MLIKQFVDEGLGNSSYLVASEATGQAIVIDPERNEELLRALRQAGVKPAVAIGEIIPEPEGRIRVSSRPLGGEAHV